MDLPLKAVIYALSQHYAHAEDTEKIIITCALTAAAADALGGAIPVLAIPATIIACFGAVWAMYGTLCSKLGISLKRNVLKLLARAALANIAANLTGAIAALAAGMVVPGASALASAVITFATVYLAGLIFLKLIVRLAEKSRDPHTFSDISESEMKKTVKDVKVGREDLEAARQVYEGSKAG